MRWNWGSDYKGARFGRCRQCVLRIMQSRFLLWASWPTAVYWRANTRITCVAFHGPPRAIGIPRSFNPAANSSQDVTSAARSSAMTGARRSPLPSGRDPRLAAIAEIALSKKETPTPGRRGLPVCPRRVTWCRRALKTAGSVCMSRPALSNCHSGQMSVNGGYRLCDRLWKG
jgi:hypothetical protein